MLNNPLANALSKMLNYEIGGKKSCLVKPVNKVIKEVLRLMNEHRYIGEPVLIDISRGGVIKVNLIGKINKCGVISPNYSVKKGDYEKFEKRYLLAKDFGIIIVSTPQGIMIHTDAKKKNLGGKLIAYCY